MAEEDDMGWLDSLGNEGALRDALVSEKSRNVQLLARIEKLEAKLDEAAGHCVTMDERLGAAHVQMETALDRLLASDKKFGALIIAQEQLAETVGRHAERLPHHEETLEAILEALGADMDIPPRYPVPGLARAPGALRLDGTDADALAVDAKIQTLWMRLERVENGLGMGWFDRGEPPRFENVDGTMSLVWGESAEVIPLCVSRSSLQWERWWMSGDSLIYSAPWGVPWASKFKSWINESLNLVVQVG